MNKDLRKITFLKPLFVVRDWVMGTFHLYRIKAALKRKFFLWRLMIEDYAKKKRINREIYAMPDHVILGSYSLDDIIISLTSYGTRVVDTLPYALYSLITQTQRPKKIVVYLDWDHWDDNKLPKLLKKIQKIGVDFRYCEDLRSFKKLIPALKDFPNNPILTVDDDFYYNPNFYKWYVDAYQYSDKKTVLGQWGYIPAKRDDVYIPYSQWKDCKYGTIDSPSSFIGCCGCCYPPNVFDDEIFKKEIFMKLCPQADDLWFWTMEERLQIKRQYITPKGYGFHEYVNRIEEADHYSTATLTYQNVTMGWNDKQLQALIDYYKLNTI